MIKRPIRNLRSKGKLGRRVFDVIVKDKQVNLEIKTGKHDYELISWDDVVTQVEIAKQMAANE